MNRKKLIGAVFISGSLTAFIAFILPRFDAIQETRAAIEIREGQVADKKKFVEKMIELKKLIEARQDDLSKVGSFISSGKQTQNVVVNLEEIAREAGVAISDFKTGSAKLEAGNNFEVLQIELIVSGHYPALSNMIKLMEKNLRIFDVQEIGLTRKEGEESGFLGANIKINSYYLK